MSETYDMSVWYTGDIDKKIRKENVPIIFVPKELINIGKKIVYGKFVYCNGGFTFIVEKVIDCD